MKQGLITGKPNVGKTLFFLQFASFLGSERLNLALQSTGQGSVPISRARRLLVDQAAHTTRELRPVELELPRGKGKVALRVFDSSGLTDGVHPDQQLRRAMADTIRCLQESDVVLHLVDADAAGRNYEQHVTAVDYELYSFGHTRPAYKLLANKLDLPAGRAGLSHLQSEFGTANVLGISAKTGQGLKQVKRFLGRAV